jgi:hypothetical protein
MRPTSRVTVFGTPRKLLWTVSKSPNNAHLQILWSGSDTRRPPFTVFQSVSLASGCPWFGRHDLSVELKVLRLPVVAFLSEVADAEERAQATGRAVIQP